MKKNYLIGVFLFFGILTANAQLGTDVFTLGADDASNYASNSWVTTMAGSGFGNWTFDTATPNGGFAGRYIGSFSTDLDVSSDSFALYANSGNNAASGASTSFPKTLEEGDVFKISVGVNFRDGAKGFDLRNSSNGTVVNFNVGSDKYTFDGTDLYGDEYDANTVITFTFTQNASTLSWVADRTGGRTESASGTVSGVSPGAITNIRLYNVSAGTNGDGGSGQRNLYLNSLSFTSKYTVPNGSSTSVTSNTTVPYLTVQSGGTVTVNSGFDLNVEGNISNNGTLNVNDGSLRVSGTSSGDVSYNRTLTTTNWYLMGSPVSGEQYDAAWVTANNIDETNGTGSNVGIAMYNTSSDSWTYYNGAGTGTFGSGTGYSIKQDATGTVSFTGTLNTADVPVALSTGGNGGFTLLANPFTSNLNSASLLGDFSANLNSQTLWVWNQGTGSYDTYVTGDSFVLAPTQGFFVSASSSGTLNILESYQTATSGTFQRQNKTEVKLFVNDGSTERYVRVNYTDNATTGFDNGWDGETFGGVTNTFDMFTNLVSDNQGKKYQVQSLPKSSIESLEIPVGVIADAGKQITFTAEALNLPTDVKVFLEDRDNNTFTRLDEANSEYKVTLSQDVNDVGRFYLHTTASALSVPEVHLENVSVYTTHATNIRIEGIALGKTQMKLVNMLGKEVLQQNFSSNGVSDIAIPKLARGIYIVQLNTEKGKLNKKIIID